jgi:hypothetical protein
MHDSGATALAITATQQQPLQQQWTTAYISMQAAGKLPAAAAASLNQSQWCAAALMQLLLQHILVRAGCMACIPSRACHNETKQLTLEAGRVCGSSTEFKLLLLLLLACR